MSGGCYGPGPQGLGVVRITGHELAKALVADAQGFLVPVIDRGEQQALADLAADGVEAGHEDRAALAPGRG